jgi:hypothetical protein
MDRPRMKLLATPLVAASLGLSSCGGGGGNGGGTTPPPGGNVTVSGTVTFDRPSYTQNNTLNFSALERLPVRGATVEILRSSDQAVLASTTTDGTSGNYSASVPAGSILVRVKAQLLKSGSGGYDFEVRNNTSNNALYSLDSAVVSASGSSVRVDLNAATGWGGSSYTGPRAAAPFAILDMLWRAKLLIQGAETNLSLPALDVYWSTLNRASDCANGQPDPTTGDIGTTFYVGGTIPATANCAATPTGIYVLGDSSGNAGDDADEFDSSVIAHEFGHYYEDSFSRSDSMGGPHYLDERHDLRLAFSEGWGNAFQGFVLDSPWYRDTFGTSGSSGFAFDMENNTAPYTSSAEFGFFAEASVQDILWDVYDGVNDDQVNLGFDPIHTVMRNEMKTTDALTSIFVMASGLEARNPSQAAAIRSRLAQEATLRPYAAIDGIGDFAANQTLPDATDLVPLYGLVSFGTPLTLISTNRFADAGDTLYEAFNRLGGRRYLRIDLPTGGGLRITAQGPVGSDPDFYLYRAGADQCPNGGACRGDDFSGANGLEEATYSGLAAGTYVLEVEECSNLGVVALCQPGPALGNTNIDVTVTQQ